MAAASNLHAARPESRHTMAALSRLARQQRQQGLKPQIWQYELAACQAAAAGAHLAASWGSGTAGSICAAAAAPVAAWLAPLALAAAAAGPFLVPRAEPLPCSSGCTAASHQLVTGSKHA